MPGGIMKLVAEYLVDAIKFDRMAEDATDVALKASFRKQAAEYRKLALKRARLLGMPPPDISPEPKTDEA
jgi:hypothetical protein